MPFETQICLILFDNLKVGLLFKYLLHIHTYANQILSERYWKTHYLNKLQYDNPGRNQIINIAHKRPIASWRFWLLDNYNNCLVLPSGYFVFTMFFQNT